MIERAGTQDAPILSKILRVILRVLLSGLLVFLVLWGLYTLISENYTFHWNQAFNHLPKYNEALLITLQISGVSMIFGTILGLLVALARISPFAILRDMGVLYVQSLRSIPFLVFVLLMYFGVSQAFTRGAYVDLLGWQIDGRLFWGSLALSLFEASFIAEIFRAGIQSIHVTQMEAARSLGMSYPQSMRYIILPQAFRVIVPPFTGEMIALVKESALLLAISVPELTRTTQTLASRYSLVQLELYALLAVYYLAITLPLAGLSYLLERTLSIKARRSST